MGAAVSLHLVMFLVDGHQPEVRDLFDEIKAAIRHAQRRGRHVDVELVRGPTILAGTAVDGLVEDEEEAV
jgi:hypothetical protein